ncbi:MAG TPA: glycosyl hydrolase family 65 protein [Herpetosiphonaceae bacterium]
MLTAHAPDAVVQHWAEAALRVPDDPAWRMTVTGYQPALEHDIETRFSIGNGFIGVRGSLEIPTRASRPRTFIAGLFDTSPNDAAHSVLVAGPDWVQLKLIVAGAPLSIDSGTTLAHHRTLDFKRGVMIGEWQQRVPTGQTIRLRTLRCASLVTRTLALQLVEISVDQPTPLTLETGLDSDEDGLRAVSDDSTIKVWRTAHSTRYLAASTDATLTVGERCLRPAARIADRQRWHWIAQPDQPAVCVRFVALARGDSLDDARHTVRATLSDARQSGPMAVLAAHEQAWAALSAASDAIVEGDDDAQQALRFAQYHLISAANPDDPHVSIGARALTGDAYQGHVFWDTEIFLLPFYTLTWPEATRALLLYRWHTLPAAREKARSFGFQGAWYAWESTDTGAEVTPTQVLAPDGQIVFVRNGTNELHISAAVAYAVWQYWQLTGDDRFLLDAGAEMILETARFWASRARVAPDGRFHIRNVIGPDEYHEGVDDNAYTNGMARWNIICGLYIADLLQQRWPDRWAALRRQIELRTDELTVWHALAETVFSGFDPRTNLFEQFAGYFALEPIDLGAYAERNAPMDVILGRERTQRSQVIKQADVLMLLALLWDQFPPSVHAANFAYYEARCGHGSSLSPVIHALVAARLGKVDRALHYFQQAAAIDLRDAMGNTALGIHIATLGGLWQALVFGVAGLRCTDEQVRCDPHLPSTWRRLEVPARWRNRRIRVVIEHPLQIAVTLEDGASLPLVVGDLARTIQPHQTLRARWDGAEGRWQEVAL